MKRVKKALCLAAVAALTISVLLSGCAKSSPVGTASSAGSTTSNANAKYVKLTYYYGGNPQTDVNKVQDAINKLLKEKINAEVQLNCIGFGDYSKKMQVMVNSQENFDLCYAGQWAFDFLGNAAKGALADITTLLPKYAPQTYASFPKSIWKCATVNGKIYASINKQIYARQAGYYVRKDYADKYGFDNTKVTKISDFGALLDVIKAREPKSETGCLTTAASFDSLYPWYGWDSIASIGAIKATESNPTVFNIYDTPEFSDFIKTETSFYSKGYIAKDILTSSSIDYTKLALYQIGTIKPGGKEEDEQKTLKHEVYEVALGSPLVTTSNVTATMTAISATSKNTERALEFIELLNTDKEIYNLICHGIKGDHYTVDSSNKITIVDNSKYNPMTDWEFGNQFNSLLLSTQADDVWTKTDELNKNSTISSAIGFNFDTTNVATEVANCKAVVDEYTNNFSAGIYGSKTAAKYQEFLEKLKNAGAKAVIAEEQKQLDQYLSKK